MKAVVERYTLEGEPVGSRTLHKQDRIPFSPATIRNILADLEDVGLLMQPHTSAGRMPTNLGYRMYVNELMEPPYLPDRLKQAIDGELNRDFSTVNDLLKLTTSLLAAASMQVAIIQAPKKNIVVKHIQLVQIPGDKILGIIVTNFNSVRNRFLQFADPITQDELTRISNFLNDNFSNLTLSQIRKRILDMMLEKKRQYDSLLAKAVKMAEQVFRSDESANAEMFVSGSENLLDNEDFLDRIAQMKALLHEFDEKRTIVDILDHFLSAEGASVRIGLEHGCREFSELTFVGARYCCGAGAFGTIGIAGPTRMLYPQMVGLIEYAAEELGHRLMMG